MILLNNTYNTVQTLEEWKKHTNDRKHISVIYILELLRNRTPPNNTLLLSFDMNYLKGLKTRSDYVYLFYSSSRDNGLKIRTKPFPVVARSTTARLLKLWVRIPPEAWMSVSCKCSVLSGGDLCDVPIPRPEESYRVYVIECDQGQK